MILLIYNSPPTFNSPTKIEEVQFYLQTTLQLVFLYLGTGSLFLNLLLID